MMEGEGATDCDWFCERVPLCLSLPEGRCVRAPPPPHNNLCHCEQSDLGRTAESRRPSTARARTNTQ